jgi:hypothetical protein
LTLGLSASWRSSWPRQVFWRAEEKNGGMNAVLYSWSREHRQVVLKSSGAAASAVFDPSASANKGRASSISTLGDEISAGNVLRSDAHSKIPEWSNAQCRQRRASSSVLPE